MIKILLIFAIAYLIGSIPSGLWIGQIFYKKDIRKEGSGNLGATNTFRVLGKTAGFIVTILDVLKGFIVVFLPIWMHADVHGIIVGLFAILGHVYPIYAHFKGGKAVATSAGVVLGINPILLLMLAVVFFGTIYLTKYVSLASIIASIANFILSFFFHDNLFTIFSFVIMVIVIVRHHTNIKRIMNKEEPKITWM